MQKYASRRVRVLAVALGIIGITSSLSIGVAAAQPVEHVRNSTFSKLESVPSWGNYATTRIDDWSEVNGTPQVWHKDMCQHAYGYQCADLEYNKQISQRLPTFAGGYYILCVDFNSNPTERGKQRLKIDAKPSDRRAVFVDTDEEPIRDGTQWRRACHRFVAESEQTRIIFTGMTGPSGAGAGAVFTNVSLRLSRASSA